MILTELKSYIQMHGRVSRTELVKQFGMSQDGVDAMLDVWIQRGEVSRELLGSGDSANCQQADEVWYRCNGSDELSVTVLR
ncbi:FeoC-like transcriptional regulator [Aliivibrio kagoshimensis]|jgi:putative ferrous iron transport protein C|uniref:FeoC-like transcriptional regulator n=1 Tax=Aliivibrio kagoshimensis TaxID=2910230 RepID=UPI003D09FFA3